MALNRSKKRISALFPVTDFTSWLVKPPSTLPQCISQWAPVHSSCSAVEVDQKLALIRRWVCLRTPVSGRGRARCWGQGTQVEKALLWLLLWVWGLGPCRDHPAKSCTEWLEGTCTCFWTTRSPGSDVWSQQALLCSRKRLGTSTQLTAEMWVMCGNLLCCSNPLAVILHPRRDFFFGLTWHPSLLVCNSCTMGHLRKCCCLSRFASISGHKSCVQGSNLRLMLTSRNIRLKQCFSLLSLRHRFRAWQGFIDMCVYAGKMGLALTENQRKWSQSNKEPEKKERYRFWS